MKKFVLTSVTFLVLAIPATAMTQRECAMIWKEADMNRDGTLNVYEETSYLAMVRMANKTMVADGTFADKLFQESCKTNILTTTVSDQVTDVEVAESVEQSFLVSQPLDDTPQ